MLQVGVSVTSVGSNWVTSVPSTKTIGLAATSCWVLDAPLWAGAAWGAAGAAPVAGLLSAGLDSAAGLAGAAVGAAAPPPPPQAESSPPIRPRPPLKTAARWRKARRESGRGRLVGSGR